MYPSGAASVLEALVDEGEMTPADASRVAELIGQQNARRVYGLAADGRA
jgi:hypothetical protein